VLRPRDRRLAGTSAVPARDLVCRERLDLFAGALGVLILARGSQVGNQQRREPCARPELFRLLADSKPGDVLLVEQVDRLSRLRDPDWRKLRAELEARQIRVVVLDLPTSWQHAARGDEFTARMFAALNAMILDMLAAVARKDYDDRRRRQARMALLRPKLPAPIAAGRRIPTGTPASPLCCAPACRGRQFKRRRAVSRATIAELRARAA
jgi:DNA invertase Pin-like site-specific DNA recombinase